MFGILRARQVSLRASARDQISLASGTMGKHFASHLHAYSLKVGSTEALVASRNASKARALRDQIGCQFRENFVALAAECDVLAMCLSTSKDVASVVRSTPKFKEGALLIDVTSGDPGLTNELGEELAARGVRLVDAPVSGGPQGAESGTCVTMLGGADADLDEASEVERGVTAVFFVSLRIDIAVF